MCIDLCMSILHLQCIIAAFSGCVWYWSCFLFQCFGKQNLFTVVLSFPSKNEHWYIIQHTWYPFTQRCSVIWRHPALMNETDFSYYKINWGKGIFDLEYRFIFTSTDTCIFNLFRFNWQILSLLQNIWNLSLTFLVTYLLIDNSETVIICMPLQHCVLFYW